MNNKGRITVFLSLITGVLLILGITVIKLVDIRAARAKASICVNASLSSVKALYNNYIFEHYHILLFDKDFCGRGEAYLEEYIKDNVSENLGRKFKVEDVAVDSYELITDNSCQALKNQIEEYVIYAGLQNGLEHIFTETNNTDGTLDEEILNEFDNEEENPEEGEGHNNSEGIEEGDSVNDDENIDTSMVEVEDPRVFFATGGSLFLMNLVLPANVTPSAERIDISGVPSKNRRIVHPFADYGNEVNLNFDDADKLKGELVYHDSWLDSVRDAASVSYYASQVFNCVTDNSVNDTTVFEYELEYLISGLNSDLKNIRNTIDEIIAIRMPVNYLFLCRNTVKKNEIKAISIPLSLLNPISERIIRLLITGCWAYAESIAETRGLLEGKKLPFMKNNENWITDIFSLGGSIFNDAAETEHGLSYKDYLVILLSLNTNRTCYRMLDLMELNAQKNTDYFQMEGCATSLSVDYFIKYKNYDCSVRNATGY